MTPPEESTNLLQDGIYIERGVPPPAAWRALLLDFEQGVTREGARAALLAVMDMLVELGRGRMRDLSDTRPGEAPGEFPAGTFVTLLGYGASFFARERHDPCLTTSARPEHLVSLNRGGPAFPAIPWAAGEAPTSTPPGEGDLILQFTGLSQHAVSRAAVEVANLIGDHGLPLGVVGTYEGFARDDGRSWLGFHDGVSNLQPSERRAAVECRGDPEWNAGGTYLAFLRLQIALKEWRALSRVQQEIIIGRDKLTGCALESVADEDGGLKPKMVSGCPVTDTSDWNEYDAYFNPPETADPLIEASHTHRVNQNRASATTAAAHRIFRQGYEYLEDLTPDGPRLGLNFVSFQNDLYHVQQILGLPGWLGDANFGGTTGDGSPQVPNITLATLRAGGFYVVPPRQEPFPGASLFR